MAEDSIPATKSGYRQQGVLSQQTQRLKDSHVRGILDTWKITDLYLAVPQLIRPSNLGTSAIANIRAISRKVDLVTAQGLFLRECKDANSAPVTLSFKHTAEIVKALASTEVARNPAQNGSGGASNMVEKNPKSKRRSKAIETLDETMGLGTPKLLNDLVAPSKNLAPPFTLGSPPASKNRDSIQSTKSNTRGVAMKKNVVEGSQSSKLADHLSDFAFLDAKSPPAAGMFVKKRPAASKDAEDKEKREEGIAFKKARKEDDSASKLIGVLFNPLDDLNKLIYEPVEAVNESIRKGFGKPSEVVRQPVKALTEPTRNVLEAPSEAVYKPVEAPNHLSDVEDRFAELDKIMINEKAENDKFFGSKRLKVVSYAAFDHGEREELFNSNTPKLPPVVLKENENLFKANNPMLASAILKENSTDGDTIVVDVKGARSKSLYPIQTSQIKRAIRSFSPVKATARKASINRKQRKVKAQDFDIHTDSNVEVGPKTTVIAPVAEVAQMLSGGSPTAPMYGNQQPEPVTAVNQAASLQSTTRQAIALQISGVQGGRFKEHCDFISSGLRDVLDTQRLFDLARPDQLPLALDLQVVFDTAIRHLEGDLAYVFKKHGADV